MQSLSVFQSSSEAVGNRRVWGQSATYNLQGLTDEMRVLEQPICRKFAFWLARVADAGGGGAQGLALLLRA